jgi:hypothetical protein
MPQIDNTEPFEVIAGPLELWIGAPGATFPELDAEPDDEVWTHVGNRGARNYDEEGVTVGHSQTLSPWFGLGGTGALKAFRGREEMTVNVKLADLSLETYSIALNSNAVTTEAGVRRIGLSRGPAVTEYALLIRGNSPYGNNLVRQYNLPRVYHTGSPEVTSVKDQPCILDLSFGCLEDLNAEDVSERFGVLLCQDGDT